MRENGSELSPEDFAQRIGLSGSTIRRWESGQFIPKRDELQTLVGAFQLSTDETEFIYTAFAGAPEEAPPDVNAFDHLVDQVLCVDFPAIIVDSLYYIRAWNDHADKLTTRGPGLGSLTHILEQLFPAYTDAPPGTRNGTRVLDWLREFRLSTAKLCGTPAYRSLLGRLSDLGDFRDLWFSMALTRSDGFEFANAPHQIFRPAVGSLWKSMSRINLPSTYFLYQYFPLDADARARFDGHGGESGTLVAKKPALHWLQDRDEDTAWH